MNRKKPKKALHRSRAGSDSQARASATSDNPYAITAAGTRTLLYLEQTQASTACPRTRPRLCSYIRISHKQSTLKRERAHAQSKAHAAVLQPARNDLVSIAQ